MWLWERITGRTVGVGARTGSPRLRVHDREMGDACAVRPPVQVALARAEHTVPGPDAGRWCYEPKFDFCTRFGVLPIAIIGLVRIFRSL